jgi:hypothetical protein
MIFDIQQISAALALAGLNKTQLGAEIGMDESQLSKVLTGKVAPREDTKRKIIRKLEDHGVEFTEHSGVRKRIDLIKVCKGSEGFREFCDDRYLTAINSSQDFLFCGGLKDDSRDSVSMEYQKFHMARMRTLKHFRIRGLRPESDSWESIADYIEYRVVPDTQMPDVPFYVYGGKVAFVRFQPEFLVIIMHDRIISDGYRKTFEKIWNIGKKLRLQDE